MRIMCSAYCATCAYHGVRNVRFRKIGVLCFLKTPVLTLSLLAYYRWFNLGLGQTETNISKGGYSKKCRNYIIHSFVIIIVAKIQGKYFFTILFPSSSISFSFTFSFKNLKKSSSISFLTDFRASFT